MSPHNKQPMSLEDLPEYLKSQRENGDMGRPNLVGTGQLITKKTFMSWSQQVILAMSLLLLAGAGSMVAYNSMAENQLTVIVDIDKNADPSQTISKIVSDSGGTMLSVKQNEDLTYEVKVSTRKSRHSFLEWFRKNKNVNKASIE